jgi:hypothetical protein
MAIVTDIGHLVRHDQMVLGIDCRLHVITDDALAAAHHRSSVWIGQGNLLVR